MKILVLGGTGTVGSLVVQGLQAKAVEFGVHTRDAAKAKARFPKAAVHTGDLVEPATVREIFRGYDGVFMLNHTATTETHEALMCLDGAMLNGVERFVYMTIHDLEKAPHLPHFGAKLPVEEALKRSKMEWTIIRPNNFHQNDYWFKDALLQHNVYPQPLGSKGLHRVDVRDIAEASVIALTQSGHAGQVYDLVGPDRITGPRCAELLEPGLGQDHCLRRRRHGRLGEDKFTVVPGIPRLRLPFDVRVLPTRRPAGHTASHRAPWQASRPCATQLRSVRRRNCQDLEGIGPQRHQRGLTEAGRQDPDDATPPGARVAV